MAEAEAETRRRLADCFSAVFPGLGEAEIAGAAFDTVEAWDSVATINLLTVVEEEFGVRFEPEDLERLTSFTRILEALRERRAAS
jgi:acyl carrier protein